MQTTVGLPLQLPWLAFAEARFVLAGMMSWKAALGAAAGPWFVIVAVYTTWPPVAAVEGEPVRRRSRFGPPSLTWVKTLRWSCQCPGRWLETQPRSRITPRWFAVTTIVTVAVACRFSWPRLQTTAGLPLQLPWLAAADTSVV